MAHSQRGENYFFLTTIKHSDPSKTTVIHHPAPFNTEYDEEFHAFALHPPKATVPLINCTILSLDQSSLEVDTLSSTTSSRSRPSSLISAFDGPLSDLSESDGEGGLAKDISHVKEKMRNAGEKCSMVPIEAEIVPDVSPYHHPRQVTLYNGKPTQTWFYDRRKHPISAPPKVPRDGVIPPKALYICDIVDSGGLCVERRVWINNSCDEGKVQWVIAHGANAIQSIDGKDYGFYIRHDGPHWVKKETLGKYKRTDMN